MRGDEAERGVRLDLALRGPAQDRVLPHVIDNIDGVEAGFFGRFDDALKRRPESLRAVCPLRRGDVKTEFHEPVTRF